VMLFCWCHTVKRAASRKATVCCAEPQLVGDCIDRLLGSHTYAETRCADALCL
jgi:hypothetical protein